MDSGYCLRPEKVLAFSRGYRLGSKDLRQLDAKSRYINLRCTGFGVQRCLSVLCSSFSVIIYSNEKDHNE